MCLEITDNADDKNPKTSLGITPLHEAAKNGHLSVCRLIVENIDDKNPKNNFGVTPLLMAAFYPEIKKLIENAIMK